MKSAVIKRSVSVNGHKTSISLEDAFWSEFKAIASEKHFTISELLTNIDGDRQGSNLSSALRVFVLKHIKHRTGKASLDDLKERHRVYRF